MISITSIKIQDTSKDIKDYYFLARNKSKTKKDLFSLIILIIRLIITCLGLLGRGLVYLIFSLNFTQ